MVIFGPRDLVSSNARRKAPSYSPRLEGLEGRIALSTATATLAGDAARRPAAMVRATAPSEAPSATVGEYLAYLNRELVRLGGGGARAYSVAGTKALQQVDLFGSQKNIVGRLKQALRRNGARFTESRSIVASVGLATQDSLQEGAEAMADSLRRIIGKNKAYKSHNFIGVDMKDRGDGLLLVSVITYHRR